MNNNQAIKNVITSLLYQVVAIVYGFVVPRIILKAFGSEVYGLVASLGQFLNYITLLEGGVTTVIMAALYKPLADKDSKKVSAVVKAADSFFKRLAFIYIAYSIIVAIFYPIFVKTSFTWGYVCSLSLIISITLFVQYFFSLTYRILITADQKGYVVSIAGVAFTLINFAFTVLVVLVYPEIHILKLFTAIAHIIQPIIYSRYVKKHYQIDKSIERDPQALSQRWDGFGQNLAFFIHSNTDVVVLTVFSTLINVSVYSVYFMIANALKQLVISISSALVPSIGNVLVKSKDDVKLKIFDFYEFTIYSITTFCFVCGALLVTPFVNLYTSGIKDANYYQPVFGYVLMFAFALYCYREPFVSVTYAAGHFKQTAVLAYIEAGLNIVISIVLVTQFGLVGVAVGTAVSLLFRMIAHVVYINKHILHRPVIKWIKSISICSLIVVLSVVVVNLLINVSSAGYLQWFLSSLVVAIIVLVILITVFFVFSHSLLIELFNKIMKKANKSN